MTVNSFDKHLVKLEIEFVLMNFRINIRSTCTEFKYIICKGPLSTNLQNRGATK